jgi:hypothetical protein
MRLSWRNLEKRLMSRLMLKDLVENRNIRQRLI